MALGSCPAPSGISTQSYGGGATSSPRGTRAAAMPGSIADDSLGVKIWGAGPIRLRARSRVYARVRAPGRAYTRSRGCLRNDVFHAIQKDDPTNPGHPQPLMRLPSHQSVLK